MINIDFEFCRKIGCDRYAPPSKVLGFDLGESCDVVTDWNAQHVYSNDEGDTVIDDEEIISWDQVPKDCPGYWGREPPQKGSVTKPCAFT